MTTDHAAQQLSSSWEFGGVNSTAEQIFKEYIAQGRTERVAPGKRKARGLVAAAPPTQSLAISKTSKWQLIAASTKMRNIPDASRSLPLSRRCRELAKRQLLDSPET
jgi:hypothetical protein